MPSRIFNVEGIQSGLDAFLSGAGEGYTGVRNERRKRQVEAQQDALLQQQMAHAEMDQQRRNIEAGVSIQQGTRPDPVTAAKTQASGVRARIGAILRGVFGGGEEPSLQPTGTLVKTGPSQQERVAQIGEEGADRRNTATIASNKDLATIREAGDDRRNAASLAYQYYNSDQDYRARMAGIAAQRDIAHRADDRAERDDLRTYGRQLNEEIASLTRQAADRNGIMQQVGGSSDPVAAYQARQRELHEMIADKRRQLQQVEGAMSRRSIGKQLAQPKPAAQAGIPSRAPTLEEDLQAAMRPGGARGGGSTF